MKQKINKKMLESKFDEYVEKQHQDSLFEFVEYDAGTKQVFLRVEGEWTAEIRQDLTRFFREHNKRISVSRLVTRVPGEEDL
jgi:hypothetical protein